MEARQQLQSFPSRALVAGLALLVAMLVGLAAGYLIRGGLPQSQAPAVATDTVPSWAHQGMGPTDADADQAAPSQCEGYACTLEGERELAERALTSSDLRQQAVSHAASERAALGGFTTFDESVQHAATERGEAG